MRFFIQVAVGVSLFWILSSFGSLKISEPEYWLRLIGCVVLGIVAGAFYDKIGAGRGKD